MKTITIPSREIPVRAEVDVLVVGGGPSGIMAAEAASAPGVKVMLIESRGYLGGNLTIGLPILSFLDRKGKPIIQGMPQNLIDRLRAQNAATPHRPCDLHVSHTMIDCEKVKTIALEIMEEKGVEVLMYVFVSNVIMDGDRIKGVVIESKEGTQVILAKTVIDCTGDGDVAFHAGAICEKGSKEDGGMQPPTLMFCMKGVNVAELRENVADHPEIFDIDIMKNEYFRPDKNFIIVGFRDMINKARAAGLKIAVDRTILITGLAKDEIWVNMSRVCGVDSTSPSSYTHGEIEARRQNEQIAEYLKRFIPGFENAWVEKVASFMGIRESRRVIGKYVLTENDILTCRRFPDAVLVASYPVDMHNPKGGDCTLRYCDESYDIPYGCFVPQKIEGLLVAGRCASTTHEAMASTRVMSTCMAMGQAVGTAARLCTLHNILPSEVNTDELRKALIKDGAYLGE